MADPKNPTDTLKGISVEELREKVALLERVNELTDKQLAQSGRAIQSAQAMSQALADQRDAIQKIIQSKEKQMQGMSEETLADQKLKAQYQARIEELKRVDAEVKKITSSNSNYFSELNRETEAQARKAIALNKDYAKSNQDISKNLKAVSKDVKELPELGPKFDISDIIDLGAGALETFLGSTTGVVAGIKNISAETAAMSIFMKGVNFNAVAAKLMAVPTQIDTSLRGVVKSGAKYSKELDNAFVSVLDPEGAQRFGMISAEAADKMLSHVGITAEDTGEALKSLRNDAMAFRTSFFIQQPEIAAQTANMIAGLKKIGVPVQESTKAIDQFTMAMKQSPAEANKSVKKLINVADSLDLNVGESMRQFTSLMPTISQFGERAVDVFADLAAQSRATGVAIGDLNSMAMKMDTFKGAAEAAQGFNAVLGGTFLSVTDLVHAEPAEKIEMIKNAMERSGTTFETAHRRVKNMIASLMGVDTERASRIFGTGDDFTTARAEVDKTEISDEELTKRIDQQMTSAEVLQKSLSATGAGFRKFVNRSRRAAQEGAKLMTDAFGETVGQIKDSERAALSLAATLQGLGRLTGNPLGATAALGAKALNDLLDDLGITGDKADKIRQAIPTAAAPATPRAAAPPAARQTTAGAGASPSIIDSAMQKLTTMHEDLIETLQGTSKSGGEFVTNLVVDGEKIAEATYEFIRDSLDSEFKLVERE